MQKHLTATVYIVSKIDNEYKVLLHLHKKHQMWLGVGGHVEADENPVEAALREAKEESGLEISLVNTKGKLVKTKWMQELVLPLAIQEEKIPQYQEHPAHFHIDFIYFGVTDTPQKVKMDEKFGWFSEEALADLKLEKDVRYAAKSTLKFFN